MIEISLGKGREDIYNVAEKLQNLLVGENLFPKPESKIHFDDASTLAVICTGRQDLGFGLLRFNEWVADVVEEEDEYRITIYDNLDAEKVDRIQEGLKS